MRSVSAFLGAAALLVVSAPLALGFSPRPAPGRLAVKLRDGVELRVAPLKPGQAVVTGRATLDRLNAAFGVQGFEAQFPGETSASKALAGYDLSAYYILEFAPDVDLEAIRAAYAADPAVEIAEFDIMVPITREPADLGTQWYLESSTGKDAHLTGGWNHSVGNASVLLAIADTGVDWQHPDLGGTGPDYIDGNIWTNTAERNGVPGVDDDANGLVDDVRGWDFVGRGGGLSAGWPGEDAAGEDNDPRDFNGHGTHVAGIAAAMTDNALGVAGVGWNCKILPLRIGGSIDSGGTEQGVVLMSWAAAAVNYARQKGAVAFNCSWGSTNVAGLGAAVQSAINAGMVFSVAAGNDNSSGQSYLSQRGDCLDVAATDSGDTRATFSNYGAWVDVSAPGVAIYSTYFLHNLPPGQQHAYVSLQGTSMAAPVVTGLVGLVRANYPGFTSLQTRDFIKAGCDNIDSLNVTYAGLLGSGRVNALRMFGDRNLTVPGDYPSFDKAMAASGPSDTLAMLGGLAFTTPWYVTRSDRRIEGGWDATFTTRDPIGNPTVVQSLGDGPALSISPGIMSSLIIDGVTFSGGVARSLADPLPGFYGGGMLCINASPVLRNCRFVGNQAGDAFTFGGGGGGFISGSAAVLENCVFASNSAQAGAGLYVHNSTVSILGGSVATNNAPGTSSARAGAGVLVDGGTLTVDGLVVDSNTGAADGGGVMVKAGTLEAQGLVCTANSAGSSGGNLYVAGGASATLRASTLRNGAAIFGAGIGLPSGANLMLFSTVIAANTAGVVGGGLYGLGASASFYNVTWDGNDGGPGGGDALFATSCPAPWTLRNCLVTNHVPSANATCTFSGAAAQLDYNTFWNNVIDVTGAPLGAHDTTADPLYVSAMDGDYQLGLHSPALDSGDPAASFDDPDGTPCDRGAFGGPDAVSAAPGPVTGVEAVRVSGPPRNVVSWSASPAPDAQAYAVYRGGTATFVPSAATFLAQVSVGTLAYTDPDGGPSDWYRVAVVDAGSASSGFGPAVQVTTLTDAPALPRRFTLHQNHPNPFNPATTLAFDLVASGDVYLDIVDATGRIVRHLVAEWREAGKYPVVWDGRDDHGRPLASGVYVSRLRAGSQSAARKMILVR